MRDCGAIRFAELFDLFRGVHGLADEGAILSKYLALGYVVQFTVCQGDCSPDALGISMGLKSAPSTWKRMRLQCASSLRALSTEFWFRESFQACQEHDNQYDGAAGSDNSDADVEDNSEEEAAVSATAVGHAAGSVCAFPSLEPHASPDLGQGGEKGAGLQVAAGAAPFGAAAAKAAKENAVAMEAAEAEKEEGSKLDAGTVKIQPAVVRWALCQTDAGQALLDIDNGESITNYIPNSERLELNIQYGAAATRKNACSSTRRAGCRGAWGLAERSTIGAPAQERIASNRTKISSSRKAGARAGIKFPRGLGKGCTMRGYFSFRMGKKTCP